MSIGEFARAVELSVSAVRFYADRGLLTPAETDPATGYRYYTEQQIPRGSMIRDLRLMELALSDIGAILEMAPGAQDEAIQDHLRQFENRLTEARRVARHLDSTSTNTSSTTTILRSVDLARAIGQVIPAAGHDVHQPHHMCVLIEVRDNSFRCVATDSHRLAVRDLVPTTIGAPFAAVVAAAEIESWPIALAKDVAVELHAADGTLTASGAELRLRCPTIPIEFPDYESVLYASDQLSTTIITDRRALLEMLGSFDGNGPIVLSTSTDELLATRDRVVRRTAASASGVVARVAVNPRFAADAVGQAVGTELIIEIDSAVDPLTFRSADDGTYTSMLMPVKLPS